MGTQPAGQGTPGWLVFIQAAGLFLFGRFAGRLFDRPALPIGHYVIWGKRNMLNVKNVILT
jgi:hypothetical protein